MVRGIATDGKKYKHVHRDEQWLCEDLHEVTRSVEHYIDRIRPSDDEQQHVSVHKSTKKTMTVDRIIAIILLGIFGSAALITGIFLLLQENYFIGAFLGLFGAIFVIAFCLFEHYR